jgi:mannose-6-phosphate isomerase
VKGERVHQPTVLSSNQPRARFYRGGERISTFRGEPSSPPNTPEDWIASTVSVRDHAPVGLTRLPTGELLVDAIASDPAGWLGKAHVDRFGPDPMMLVKLLDPGQRLPVHAHPDDAFAARQLGAAHGKVEAWYILEPGEVWLGLREGVDPSVLSAVVDAQDTTRLLGLLNVVPVRPHDIVFVPAGVLHAIGEGVVLVEVQQPEDLSILLEWDGFDLDGRADGHLGLGFDTALTAVETTARDAVGLIGAHLVSDEFFRFEPHRGQIDTVLEAGFAVLVVVDGAVRLGDLELGGGATVLIPYGAGALSLVGDGSVVVVRPPSA